MMEGDVDGGEESRKKKGQGWRAGGGCRWDLMDDSVGARHPLSSSSCPSPVPSLCSSPCHPIGRPVGWAWFPLDGVSMLHTEDVCTSRIIPFPASRGIEHSP